ncbi:MAG: hypothetical protein ACU85V_06015 [Gammaproteobacteria bacterium]
MLGMANTAAFDTGEAGRALAYFEVPLGRAAAVPAYTFGLRVADAAGNARHAADIGHRFRAAPLMDLRADLGGLRSLRVRGREVLGKQHLARAAEDGSGSSRVVITVLAVAALAGGAILIAEAIEDDVEEEIGEGLFPKPKKKSSQK